VNEKGIRDAIRRVTDALGPSAGVAFLPVAVGALAAYALPPGCAVYGIETEMGPPDTTTSTTSTGNHSSTSTTSESSCEADLVQAMGTLELCSRCLQAHCCDEAVTYVAMPTGETLLALFDCGVGVDNTGPCYSPCVDAPCGYAPHDGSELFYACTRCIEDSDCCTLREPCESDQMCRTDCIHGEDAACCEPGSLYEPYDACVQIACGYVCPSAFACPASHQGEGEGGAGGGGGSTGGAAGAAGTGGGSGGTAGAGGAAGTGGSGG